MPTHEPPPPTHPSGYRSGESGCGCWRSGDLAAGAQLQHYPAHIHQPHADAARGLGRGGVGRAECSYVIDLPKSLTTTTTTTITILCTHKHMYEPRFNMAPLPSGNVPRLVGLERSPRGTLDRPVPRAPAKGTRTVSWPPPDPPSSYFPRPFS